jgi:hypothetical protein|tara:strand:+ start:616 stop:1224 length:609 start_codon:yes stop_codon:yes gene_type:complete
MMVFLQPFVSIFDQAWALAKMPIYETDTPGIRFVTRGKDESDWMEQDNVHGYVPGDPSQGQGKIEYMTPAQFGEMTTGDPKGAIYGESSQRRQGPFYKPPFDKDMDPFEYLALEEKANESNKYLAEKFPVEQKSPRERGDTFYQDLMDRAEAGEDILFGMPYVFSEHHPNLNHDGRHRMAELYARGYGNTPFPVKVMRGTHG